MSQKKRYRAIRLAVERTGGNLSLFCSIANVNRKNYYSFLNQKEKTYDDELIEFIVTTQRKHHFGIGYRTMTSMIKNHNERPKSELVGLPPELFRLQNNSVVTAAKHNKKLITAAVFRVLCRHFHKDIKTIFYVSAINT